MACENEIHIIPDNKNPQLIMNALLNADKQRISFICILVKETASAASMKQLFSST